MLWAGMLAVQGVVFVIWTWLAYRSLFRLRARAVERTGHAFPGLSATLESFAAFLRHPDYTKDRRQLGLATAAMMATLLANGLLRASHG